MTKKSPSAVPVRSAGLNAERRYTFLLFLADWFGLSDRTVRTVLSNKPVTVQTALKIARKTGCPMEAFRIKADKRGRKNQPKS